jgi:hypothetical protein
MIATVFVRWELATQSRARARRNCITRRERRSQDSRARADLFAWLPRAGRCVLLFRRSGSPPSGEKEVRPPDGIQTRFRVGVCARNCRVAAA